jgi:hypothetical protein
MNRNHVRQIALEPNAYDTPRRITLPVALMALLCVCAGAVFPASANQSVAIGIARIDFRDEGLSSLYGSPFAPFLSLHLGHIRRISFSGGCAFAHRSRPTGTVGYVEAGETAIDFIPIHFQVSLVQPLTERWELRAGPRLAWTWFQEEWSASVPDAGLDVRRNATGEWFAFGGLIEVSLDLGPPGRVSASFEWLWAHAERRAVPGNDEQTREMQGGWNAIHLTWEMPWRLW